MNKKFGSSRGQIMVLYAGAIVALVGVLSLCADVAVMYVNWQQMQKTADAAAIAGASYLAATGNTFSGTPATGCTGDEVQKAACTYAVNNGLSASQLVPAISETATTVQVSAQDANVPYLFAKVLGMNTYSVEATAVAAIQPVGNSDFFPMGLQCGTGCTPASLIGGQPLSLGTKFVGGLAPGNWQWLDPTGTHGGGVPDLTDAIKGTAQPVSLSAENSDGSCPSGNCTVDSEPGNSAANAKKISTAFSNRMNSCPATSSDPCSGSNPQGVIPPNDPCLVVMPIVNFAGCTGSCVLQIQGFAQVYLEPSSTTANLNGCFVSLFDPGSSGNSLAQNFGPIAPPVLTQ